MTRLVCTTPYRENAIVTIARTSAEHMCLDRFYTTLYLASWQHSVQRIPFAGSRLVKEFSRRFFTGLPLARVTNVATLPELVHIGSRRLFGRRWPALSADLMYRVKSRFDSAVAQKLERNPPDVLVGMYGASLTSFRAIKRHGGLAVLNFVNSHPAEHNRYLFEHADLRAPHHELIPDWVARRVEAELEIADLILVPSHFVAEQLHAHGVPQEKVATLPYGVDLSAFYPRQWRTEQDSNLECLYVGQISHRKGMRTLLEAARHCSNLPVRFRLIGPLVSPEVLNGLPDNVIYEGASPPGGIAEAMRQADLFVLPTIEDSFGLVVLEAMATALPVITTTHAGVSELIEHGRDGLIVSPGDSTALVEAIGQLVGQLELRARLGDAARNKVQQAHSWEAYGQAVLTAIDERRQHVSQLKQSAG